MSDKIIENNQVTIMGESCYQILLSAMRYSGKDFIW